MIESVEGERGATDPRDRPKTVRVPGAGASSISSTRKPDEEALVVDPEGYVKVWRRLLRHPLWKSANSTAKVLFIHILLTANWRTGKWLYESTVIDIAPGERIGSSTKIAAELGLTRKEFRHAVQVLQELEILAKHPIKPTSVPSRNNQGTKNPENDEKGARDGARDKKKRYTRLTLINWDRWQGSDETAPESQGPEKGPCAGQTGARLGPEKGQTGATIKEGKKLRREEEPPLSDGNPPSDSTPLNLTSPDGNGPGKRKLRKPVKSETMGWPPWKLAAWQTIYSEDPKKYYAAGAIEIFNEAVETEAQASWLTAAHREQCAACPATKWPGLRSWLEGQTRAMRSGITVEQASNGMEAF